MAVRKSAPVTGRDLKTARVQKGQLGEPTIGFSLTPEGGQKFKELTSANINRQLAIVLDNKIESAPNIESAIVFRRPRRSARCPPTSEAPTLPRP